MADITEVTAVDNPTETSTTYVRVADMVHVTPASGEYLVLFTSAVECDSSANPLGAYIITVGGTDQAHSERWVLFEESSANAPYAICTSAIVTVNGSQDIEIKQKIAAGTVTMHQRALTIFGPIDGADTFQAEGTTNDTSATSSDTRLDDMILTPGVGDYLLTFSGSFNSSLRSADELAVTVFVNGSAVPHTLRHVEMEGSMDGGNRFHVLIAAKVSPAAAQDVEIMWRRLQGTATWTGYNRTLSLVKVDAADIKEVSATADHSDVDTSDEIILGMTLTDPGVGDWLTIFSSSWTFGSIGANVTVTSSLYNAGSQVTASERIPAMDGSIDNASMPWGMHGGKVVVAGGTDDIDARWRASTTDSRTIHQRTLVAIRATVGPEPTITDVETDEEYDDEDTAITATGTNFEATKGTGKVEVSDNAVYASGAKIEQTTTAWGATSIDYTADLGSQSPGNKWLWVTNNTGDRNIVGFPVTVHRAHELRMIASPNIAASGEATTQQMTPPATKAAGDFDVGRIQDDENPADTINITLDDYTEMEWCFELKANAPASQAYLFRVTKNGVVIDTYTVTPQVTVSTADTALAASVSCGATAVGALTTAIQMAASVAASAVAVAALTTAITLSAVVSASAAAVGALTTAIPLVAAVSGSASASGALTTSISLAASVSGSATVAGALTTSIRLAAAVNGTASTAAALTTSISLAGAVSGSASVAGALTTQITLAASVTGSATTAAALTTSIPLAASVTGTAVIAGTLTDWVIPLNAAVTCSAVTAGALTTQIALAANVSGAVTVAAALTTSIPLAGSVAGSATAAGALTTQIGLAAAVTGSVTSTAALTTSITLAASVSASASTVAALTTQIPFAAAVTGSASTAGALTTQIALAASVTGAVTTAAALTTQITLVASVTGTAVVAGDLSLQVLFAASVTASATTVAALTTQITLAASVSGSATAAAALTTSIPLAAAVSGSATTAGALTTGIALAATATGSASVAGALTTQIPLAGSVAGSASVAAVLTTQITLAASVSGSASVAGALTTSITLAASVSGSATTAAALTTQIALVAAVTGTVTVVADLTLPILFEASVTATASATGALTTQITLAASVAGSATTAAVLTTQIPLVGSVTGSATTVAALTTQIALAASVSGSATTTGALTTSIPLAASITVRVTVSGTLEPAVWVQDIEPVGSWVQDAEPAGGVGGTETLRPDGDIAVGDWTTAPLFSKVNDESDGMSIGIGGPDPADGTLSFPTPSNFPGADAAGFTLRIKARYTSGADREINAQLTDGVVSLGNLLVTTLTSSFAWYESTNPSVALTAAQLAALEVDLIGVIPGGATAIISQVEVVLTYAPAWVQDAEPAGSWVQDAEPAAAGPEATETLRPDGDTEILGDWVTPPLFEKVNDQSDGTTITVAGTNPIDCVLTFPVPSQAHAASVTGYKLRVRARRNAGTGDLYSTVQVGSRWLSTMMSTLTGSLAWYEIEGALTLTPTEFRNLKVDMDAVQTGGGDEVAVSQVELLLTYALIWVQDTEPAGSWVQD